jgi:toxin-antitoxin system PIN domain toxin
VIAVDANVLIYATTGCPEQERALPWLDEKLNGHDRVGLPWLSLLAFIRVVTNRRLYEIPMSMGEAWEQVEAWLALPIVWIPTPTDRHRSYLKQTLQATAARPQLVSDAHLAALAMEHGLTLYSADGDFGRFPGLKWVNPLVS